MLISDFKKQQSNQKSNSNILSQRFVILTFVAISVLLISCHTYKNGSKDIYSFFDPRIDYSTIKVNDVDIIISNGADVNEIFDYDRLSGFEKISVLMHVAQLTDKPDIIDALVKRGAKVDYKDSEENSALSMAAIYNPNPLVIRALIKSGSRISEVNKFHRSPIVRAIENNPNPDVIRELLTSGASIDKNDTMLRIRIDKNLDVSSLKLSKVALSTWNLTPYNLIASYREEMSVIENVFNQENVNIIDNERNSILLNAAINNKNPKVIGELVKKGADINYNIDSASILMEASEATRYPENIQALVDAGLDVNYSASEGNTALHKAVRNEYSPYQVSNILIKNGARINAITNSIGLSPLFDLVEGNSDVKTLGLLINYGANLNQSIEYSMSQSSNGALVYITPEDKTLFERTYPNFDIISWKPSILMYAASECRNPDIINALIKAGAHKNYVDLNNNSLLLAAVIRNQSIAIIKTIVTRNAHINHKNKQGQTALMMAAKYEKDPRVIKLLIDIGADASIKDSNGNRALDYVDIVPNSRLRNSPEFELLKNPAPKLMCWFKELWHYIF